VSKAIVVLLAVLGGMLIAAGGEAASATSTSILAGPLAQLDIKDAEIAPTRGVPKGTFTIAQHFALDPTWLDPQDHIVALTQQHYDYLVHDAMVKTMPQGLLTYSLAEHAEATADFTKVAFRLRQGLKFHDGQPPDLSALPEGCSFHPRCPYAMDHCSTEEPTEHRLDEGGHVRCWLAMQEAERA
jgi:ABC-type transport system substrate-binding protein